MTSNAEEPGPSSNFHCGHGRFFARRLFSVLACLLAIPAGAFHAIAAGPSSDDVEFFEKSVRPLLVEKCQKCHGSQRQKGGLRLDSREALLKGGESGPVVVPGRPEKSELVRAVNYEADGFQMPPTGKLDPDAIATLTQWVRRGAPWPETASGGHPPQKSGFDFANRARHWAFQPLRNQVAPPNGGSTWSKSPIDGFIEAGLRRAGIEPAATADRRTLLRRVTFDLTGLPPTSDEIHDFLADSSPAAYEKVVERLLASPRYGVRWGRHWLDLVRYAETYGHEFDFEIPSASPYRDYVVRAFNDDVPYDQLVTEHLAGDLIPAPRKNLRDGQNESIIGTAFWWFSQGKHSPVDLRAEECDTVDNQIDVLGKTFLGLSIACARCHDHKFDPIRADDYYALAGFLQSSRQQLGFLGDSEPIEHFRTWQSLETKKLVSLIAPFAAANTTVRRALLIGSNAELATLSDGSQFTSRRIALGRRLEDLKNRARPGQKDVVFEDFLRGTFDGWRTSGPAFGHRPSRAGDFLPGTAVNRPVAEFAPHGAAHSGLVAPELHGALRSKTFTIDKPFIHYRATRRGATPAAPAQFNLATSFKTGQLNLIVDGFQIIRDPLYGQLSLNVPKNADAAWYTQDVSKFIGSRAYIEIVDEDDGWITVDSILFSDHRDAPPLPPNELLRRLVNDASIDGREKLAAGYGKLIDETLALWRIGAIAEDPFAADRVALLTESVCEHRVDLDDGSRLRLAAILDEINRGRRSLPKSERVIAMTDGTAENEHVLIRGNPNKPGAEVPRRFLEVFGGHAADASESGSGRLGLAKQFCGLAAPLLARVFVNRLWQHHFGRGLVSSVDDFGKMGQSPTHPELLDYLAAELIRTGWSIKPLQRMMVLSAAYRMSSGERDSKSAAIDPDDRLLHRMRVQRLEAEAIRDAILAVSGQLDERMEGPSVPIHLDGFMTGRGKPIQSGPLDGRGRRSIYLNVRRNFLTPMFLAFDYPTPFTTAGRRATSNVPAQALTLLNNPFVLQQADRWSKSLCGKNRASAPERTNATIFSLYETAFARLPTGAELNDARQFLAEEDRGQRTTEAGQTWSDLCHVLFNVKEFIYIN